MQQTNFESQESYEAYIKYSLEQTQNIENEQYQDDDVENLAIQNKEMQKIQKENPISISTKSTEFSKEKSSDSFSEQNNNGYLSKTNSQNDQETKSKLQQENNYLYDGEISTFKLGPHLALHFNPENQTLTLSNQCIDQLGVQELGDQIEKHSKDLQILVLRLKQDCYINKEEFQNLGSILAKCHNLKILELELIYRVSANISLNFRKPKRLVIFKTEF